jgi:hypothetical protein
MSEANNAPANPAGQGGSPDASANPGGNPSAAGDRPAHIPEQFWDSGTKSVRVDELAKGYGEIHKLVSKRASELNGDEIGKLLDVRVNGMKDQLRQEVITGLSKDRPAKPEDYSLELAPEFAAELPEEFRDWKEFKDDPLMVALQRTAHSLGLGNTGFQQLIGTYFKTMGALREASFKAEMEALGGNASERVESVALAVKAVAGEEEAAALMDSVRSAKALYALEKLLASKADPRPGAGNPVPPRHVARSAAELRKMQADPRYWNPQLRDPAYVREIEEGWKRLHGGN